MKDSSCLSSSNDQQILTFRQIFHWLSKVFLSLRPDPCTTQCAPRQGLSGPQLPVLTFLNTFPTWSHTSRSLNLCLFFFEIFFPSQICCMIDIAICFELIRFIYYTALQCFPKPTQNGPLELGGRCISPTHTHQMSPHSLQFLAFSLPCLNCLAKLNVV